MGKLHNTQQIFQKFTYLLRRHRFSESFWRSSTNFLQVLQVQKFSSEVQEFPLNATRELKKLSKSSEHQDISGIYSFFCLCASRTSASWPLKEATGLSASATNLLNVSWMFQKFWELLIFSGFFAKVHSPLPRTKTSFSVYGDFQKLKEHPRSQETSHKYTCLSSVHKLIRIKTIIRNLMEFAEIWGTTISSRNSFEVHQIWQTLHRFIDFPQNRIMYHTGQKLHWC